MASGPGGRQARAVACVSQRRAGRVGARPARSASRGCGRAATRRLSGLAGSRRRRRGATRGPRRDGGDRRFGRRWRLRGRHVHRGRCPGHAHCRCGNRDLRNRDGRNGDGRHRDLRNGDGRRRDRGGRNGRRVHGGRHRRNRQRRHGERRDRQGATQMELPQGCDQGQRDSERAPEHACCGSSPPAPTLPAPRLLLDSTAESSENHSPPTPCHGARYVPIPR